MKTIRMASLVLCVSAMIVLTGCTAIVRPSVSPTEFLTMGVKEPGRAELYVTDEFRTHVETKTDVMDMKKWQFELGPVAADTFRYALEAKFLKVDVKLGSPTFPLQESANGDLLVVVEPSFSGFSSKCPFLFKFENYVVKVSFRVKAYDRAGTMLIDQVYQGVGKKRGSIGYESAGHAANPEAARLAVNDAVDKAVTDIMHKIKIR